ncbi:arsenite methyltransferase [Svornostia abyssi]|uniref:Arsenite methyltransferase n=1 Tax=Svornostia abyssi TaxID=2898438 RepID=A0ABY5PAP1_9ACTN|nr:arsenite methyltransferase [Parviterribacteraceae bacterium J379]
MGTADTDIHSTVRDTYARAACCAPEESALAEGLYDAGERASLPDDAVAAALGCANPAALAALQPGERVLDLGSGGGIDVLLSARRVGPAGFAFGLDMTPEMLALAERNRAEAGLTNVQFLRGRIEDIPLPADAVDVVLSNCVVNLSPDKRAVFSEALRVLRPGGRLAIADIATRGALPPTIGASLAAWAGCIAGALDVSEIETMLADVGFAEPAVEVVRAYGREDLDIVASSALAGLDLSTLREAELDDVEGRLVSVFIRGRKPGA